MECELDAGKIDIKGSAVLLNYMLSLFQDTSLLSEKL